MKSIVARTIILGMTILSFGARSGAAQNPIVEQLKLQWEASRRQMVQIAEAMPEDKFHYRPTPDVRTFGEIIIHVAGENMTWLENVAGAAKPGVNERFENLKSRQEILKALSDHFDYGSKVLANLDDKKAMETITLGRNQSPRWVVVMRAVGHNKEHYGNLVTYMRLNNLVPPSTASRTGGGA